MCASTSETASYLQVGEFEYVQCRNCGVVRLEPFPDPDGAAALYGDDYFHGVGHGGYADYVADAGIHRRNGRARMAKLGAPDRPGDVMVDVGCAHGFTMMEASLRGWTPMGVDVNATARAAGAAAGFATAPSIADLGVGPGTAGAVTFFQSLEHLPDPVAALTAAAAMLGPGGRVLIETWDRRSRIARLMGRRWQQATPPSVLWLFDEADVRRMCERAGLDLVRWRRSAKWVSLGLVTGQLARRGSRLGRLLDRRISRIPLPYALGDLVTAHIRTRA